MQPLGVWWIRPKTGKNAELASRIEQAVSDTIGMFRIQIERESERLTAELRNSLKQERDRGYITQAYYEVKLRKMNRINLDQHVREEIRVKCINTACNIYGLKFSTIDRIVGENPRETWDQKVS